MKVPIRMFGSDGPLPMSVVPDDVQQRIVVQRELWFDQDIDGRWLVVAVKHDGQRQDGHTEQDGDVGAIVVTDPRVVAFIELLGELVVDPARFRHEPCFDS